MPEVVVVALNINLRGRPLLQDCVEPVVCDFDFLCVNSVLRGVLQLIAGAEHLQVLGHRRERRLL